MIPCSLPFDSMLIAIPQVMRVPALWLDPAAGEGPIPSGRLQERKGRPHVSQLGPEVGSVWPSMRQLFYYRLRSCQECAHFLRGRKCVGRVCRLKL